MNLRVSEQIRFEEKLLEIFDRFFETYNPRDHWKTMLDMERDFGSFFTLQRQLSLDRGLVICYQCMTFPEDGDSEAIVHQKRIERLRYVLMMPPGKLAPDKKPDFGDHCGTIINCPDEIEMNRHMMVRNPYLLLS